ncbi:MAG: IS4 family transposase [Deltaproteobacteria bacterium]|jgi:hypothetical protein|nr:IS4 family transposase [Deltaproteobacteria bacterium]
MDDIAKSSTSLIRQLLASGLGRREIQNIAADLGTDKYVKEFNSFAHYTTMMFSQISGADSLRDTVGGIVSNRSTIRELQLDCVPNKSTLSYANAHRDYRFFERVFAGTLEKIKRETAPFALRHPFAFDNPMLSLDSSVITLCYSLFDWAKYRTAKGGVKIHVLLDNSHYLPQVVGFSNAKEHDINFARTLALPKGTIVIMDRGYFDFSLLFKWTRENIYFVTRIKSNTEFVVVKQAEVPPAPDSPYREDLPRDRHGPNRQKKPFTVVRDQLIELSSRRGRSRCPVTLRLVTAEDPDTGEEYRFLTNIISKRMSCHVVAAIYRERWSIETFFKTIKQNMVIKTFLGTSENAVRIQIFVALTAMLLIALLKHRAAVDWNFSNLLHLIRINLFSYFNIHDWANRPHCEKPPPEANPPPENPVTRANSLF